MKTNLLNKYITAFLFTIGSFYTLQACDVCGGGVGGNYLGLLPQFQKHFFGIRYQYKSFESTHLTLFDDEVPMKTYEKFHSAELWGRFVVNSKIHLFAFLPYSYNRKNEEGKLSSYQGLGDMTLLANYIIFNTADFRKSDWRHALQAGVGIKLPTGKSNKRDPYSNIIVQSIQNGTGSFDIPINLNYTLRYKDWGLSVDGSYKFNLANKRDYKFGDNINAALRAFYWFDINGISLLPSLGLAYEKTFLAHDRGVEMPYSGRASLLSQVAVDFYYKNLIIGLQMQNPLAQNLAQKQMKEFTRFRINLSFLI